MQNGAELASLSSTAENFIAVKARDFFTRSKFSSTSFEDNFELVGEGTYGKVYKAKLKRSEVVSNDSPDSYKALKFLKLDSCGEGFPITSLREVLILKELKHQNVICLEDIFHFNSTKNWRCNKIYLVFEHMPHDLMGLVDSLPNWGPAELKCILQQMLQGLDYMHSNNYYHRDLKSSNVLVSATGEVKLGDLGLAKFADPR